MGNEVDLSHLRVLVIDDDIEIGRIVDYVLRDMGVGTIRRVDSGEEGVGEFSDGVDNFDVIICDWTMPGMSGLEVLKAVRAKAPNLPFIMLTSRLTREAVEQAKQAGVTAYVAKPFTVADLQKKLRIIIARGHMA